MKLIEGCVYRLKSGEHVLLKWFGQTGKPVFQPLGEPSFQDAFVLQNWEEKVVEFIRVGTEEDRGGLLRR